MRLEDATEKVVDEEARRTRRSKSAVVEALTEEAACTRRFPGIAVRGDDARRRAWVMGSGLDVWEVVQMVEEFSSAEKLVAGTQLTLPQVRLALAYRNSYPEEVEEAIADNRRPLDEVRTLFPFIEVVEA